MSVDSIPKGTVSSAEEIARKLYEAAELVEQAQGLSAMASRAYQEGEDPRFASQSVMGISPMMELLGRELHRQSAEWRSVAAARKSAVR